MPKQRKPDDERQRPEGRLLWRAQTQLHLTDAEAAAKVNVKPATWANWVKGYRSTGRGEWAPVVVDAIPLAVAAAVFAISETQLREAGRADAATELAILLAARRSLVDSSTPLRRLIAIRDEVDSVIDELRSVAQEPGR